MERFSRRRAMCRWLRICRRILFREASDVSRFGLIFAGAQKNLGPSGVTVVIVRRDLAERADKNLPTLLQYRTEIKERSLFHTPPTFAVYIVGLVLEWLAAEGGVAAAWKSAMKQKPDCFTTRSMRAAFTLARSRRIRARG